jgi:hypothetical protein
MPPGHCPLPPVGLALNRAARKEENGDDLSGDEQVLDTAAA